MLYQEPTGEGIHASQHLLPKQTLLPTKRLRGASLPTPRRVPRILSAAFSSESPYSPSSSCLFCTHVFVDGSAEAWKALLLPWQL